MKKILILLALLVSTASLMAEPIGEKRARQIAEDFFSQYASRATTDELSLEWAGNDIGAATRGSSNNDALMYIYNRGTDDGFVVVAGDSNIAPIIAYSFNTTLDTSDMAEATRAILDAWCKQVAAARLSTQPVSEGIPNIATRSSDYLLYDTAIWNQHEPYNWEAPVYNGYRSVTGCVATAMSIICHYNQWPSKGTGTTPAYSYTDPYGYTRSVAANTLGRTYQYSSMLKDYNNGYNTTQGNAVAALMKDMGTSVQMMYHYTGSSAYDSNAIMAFTTYFRYSKSAKYAYRSSYPIAEWNELIRENLDSYGPTYYCGQSDQGGHAFVVDGYNGDYLHFNFGWGGSGNGFFLCPNIEYYAGQMALLGLKPDKNGTSTYTDNLVLYPYDDNQYYYNNYRGITTAVTSFNENVRFNVLIGTFYNIGPVVFDGNIRLMLTDRSGKIKQELTTLFTQSITPGSLTWDYDYYATITTTIEEGDRLRVYYKGKYSNDWQWMRSMDYETCYDEIVLRPTAEEIAQNLKLEYNKNTKTITYSLPYAHDFAMTNATNNTSISTKSYAPRSVVTIDVSEMVDNDVTDSLDLSFTIKKESYTVRIKL